MSGPEDHTTADPLVGIDLGTTNSAIGLFGPDGVRLFHNALGDVLTPSVVAWDERESRLCVGRTAKDIWAVKAEMAAGLFKRGMGSKRIYTVGPQKLNATELSALVLKSLRDDAERALSCEVTRAVVTVPAYFNEDQRRATREAGRLAGLRVERILNEPTAAAIAHGLHQRQSDGTLLVVDLGGGTFDVCVMDRFEGALEVRSVAGASHLGGEDFTRRIASLALERLSIPYELAEMADPDAIAQLVRSAELFKRKLSTLDKDARLPLLNVPPIKGRLDERTPLTLTRDDIEQALEPLLSQITAPIRTALRSAELTRHQIDELILVGGATRLPFFREIVERIVPVQPHAGVDPDRAIVHGAVILAALNEGHAAVQDVVVVDVASHSLGVNVTRQFGPERRGGYFSPIIHRNTTIPTSRTDVFSTLDYGQTSITFDVYEGEARHVKDNRKIGQLVVSGIPKGPPGQSVEVRFTYDLDGILAVDATILETGKTVSKVFHQSGRELNEAEITKVAAHLEKLKADPRDDPKVRDLIARAEATLRELAPEQRDALEDALDAVETALVRGNQDELTTALGYLSQLCDRFDDGERW